MADPKNDLEYDLIVLAILEEQPLIVRRSDRDATQITLGGNKHPVTVSIT